MHEQQILVVIEVKFLRCDAVQDARAKLTAVAQHLRQADMRAGGGHTAAADLVHMFATTQHWFAAERRYRAHESAPVRLNHADLFLDRTATSKRQAQAKADPYRHNASPMSSDDEGQYDGASSGEEPEGPGLRRTTARTADKRQASAPPQQLPLAADAPRKKYSQHFIWGQLSGWFKQTVYDPAATLSAERRGTLSLPDIESAYGGASSRYDARV